MKFIANHCKKLVPPNRPRQFSLPIDWRADIVNDGDIPSREEHVFAYEMDFDEFEGKRRFGYYKSKGKMSLKEAFVAGYGIPFEKNTCRTWDGRSPLQKCKFPFKIQVAAVSKTRDFIKSNLV